MSRNFKNPLKGQAWEYDGKIVEQTPKAIRITIDQKTRWIPRSAITEIDANGGPIVTDAEVVLRISAWWVTKNWHK